MNGHETEVLPRRNNVSMIQSDLVLSFILRKGHMINQTAVLTMVVLIVGMLAACSFNHSSPVLDVGNAVPKAVQRVTGAPISHIEENPIEEKAPEAPPSPPLAPPQAGPTKKPSLGDPTLKDPFINPDINPPTPTPPVKEPVDDPPSKEAKDELAPGGGSSGSGSSSGGSSGGGCNSRLSEAPATDGLINALTLLAPLGIIATIRRLRRR